MFLCSGHGAELPIADGDLVFEYNSEYWSPVGDHATLDLWAFSDKALFLTGAVTRIDIGTKEKLSDGRLREFIGEGYDRIDALMLGSDDLIYRLSRNSEKKRRWVSYSQRGTLAYFVFVESDIDSINDRKLEVLRFLSGLKLRKKTEPNKVVGPTTMRITDPASAGSAPRMVAAQF